MTDSLLNIDGVSKFYRVRKQRITALHNVSLNISSDVPKIVALAGESGSGKSTLANLVLGFTQPDEGSVYFQGSNIATKNNQQLRQYRRDVQAVFQDPFGVFNPFYRVRHVFELIFRNFAADFPKATRQAQIEQALNSVGLPEGDILQKYPHQLSGGQRQRIMMARACLMRPRLIVADEPVSMVDASLRAAILDVMVKLRDDHGIAFLYITHDLATAYQVCDEIVLLYQGRVMEHGHPTDVIGSPRHPYSKLLVSSIPTTQYSREWATAPLTKASDSNWATTADMGCCFAPRCSIATKECDSHVPSLDEVQYSNEAQHDAAQARRVACHYRDQV